ncbi:MAG: hypothetical protein J6V72_16090 [Kiritimatiellae bacterium]|nr:hypothetical protein [Kiritimatiellia bacterium]
MMARNGVVVFTVAALVAVGAHEAHARGESWVPKPPPPPSVATLTNEARYLEWKWRMDVTDPATGVDKAKAKAKILALSRELEPKEPWNVVKATCFAWLCDNVAIDVSPLDWFPAFSLWNRYERPMNAVTGRRNGEIDKKYYPEMRARINKGNAIGRYTVWKDFDHIIPEWDKVLTLGFPGMKSRLRANWKDDVSYYRAELMASDAVDRLLNRLIAQGRARGGMRAIRQAESLTRLRDGAPQTAYDVMQFIYLYFVLSEHFEAVQARSLSIIDQTLWPYYQADLAAGRTTEAEFREQFAHFLWQWGSIDNYWGQPVTMGGTKADGTTEYNPLSLVILDVMDQCALPTPKFHLKIAPNTPDAVLNKSLDMARRHRPISFIGEQPVRAVLEHLGFDPDDARRFVTKGCYEFCTPEAGNGLGGGHVNLVKVVEMMLADAKAGTFAANDFAAFKAEYLRRAAATAEEVREFFFTFEKHLDDVNPALVASLAGEFSVQTGRDALANGTRTGNSTGVCLSGFGTAVDALLAVEEIVYERKEMSLAELGALMAANWKGREELRLRMLRSKRKWGVNDPEANALGSEIAKRLSSVINGRPNSRNGRFRMSGHNARQFIVQGAKTGATPDGRRKGEEFSKNLSPTMGADTEGVTALVQTLGALDSKDFPGDFPLDVMLLPYTVSGDKGLEMMKALLSQYYANGGLMMQFNVFDAEELKDAQAHPEKYENLQVRVCGWNVRWNDLPKVEQDAYIRRAEEIAR